MTTDRTPASRRSQLVYVALFGLSIGMLATGPPAQTAELVVDANGGAAFSTLSGAVAAALKADRLLLLTDVAGVKNADGDVVTELTAAQIRDMTAEGIIAGGMIPKIEYGLKALESGVEKVQIINGTKRHSILLELFTDSGIGTEVTA